MHVHSYKILSPDVFLGPHYTPNSLPRTPLGELRRSLDSLVGWGRNIPPRYPFPSTPSASRSASPPRIAPVLEMETRRPWGPWRLLSIAKIRTKKYCSILHAILKNKSIATCVAVLKKSIVIYIAMTVLLQCNINNRNRRQLCVLL